jgi:hypothetical protein
MIIQSMQKKLFTKFQYLFMIHTPLSHQEFLILCMSLSPLESRCEDRTRFARDLLGEMVLRKTGRTSCEITLQMWPGQRMEGKRQFVGSP